MSTKSRLQKKLNSVREKKDDKHLHKDVEEFYKTAGRFCNVVYMYITQAINDPSYIRSIMEGDFSRTPQGICYHSMPSTMSNDIIDACMDLVHPFIPKLIADTIRAAESKPVSELTNLEFLGIVSSKRDWFEECQICFESMFCKTCPRRHAIIFKPCGHAVCEDCSEKFTNCPSCRQVITSKFSSTGDVDLPGFNPDDICDKVVDIMIAHHRIEKIFGLVKGEKKVSTKDILDAQLKVQFNGSEFRCEDEAREE